MIGVLSRSMRCTFWITAVVAALFASTVVHADFTQGVRPQEKAPRLRNETSLTPAQLERLFVEVKQAAGEGGRGRCKLRDDLEPEASTLNLLAKASFDQVLVARPPIYPPDKRSIEFSVRTDNPHIHFIVVVLPERGRCGGYRLFEEYH
jgi:hypothetical protein